MVLLNKLTTRKQKLYFFIISLFFYVGLLALSIFLIMKVDQQYGLPAHPLKGVDFSNKFKIVFLILAVGPLFEELAFRKHFEQSKSSFYLSIGFLVGMLFFFFTGYKLLSAIGLVWISTVTAAMILAYRNDLLPILSLQKWSSKHTVLLMILTSLLFSYLHYAGRLDFDLFTEYYVLVVLLPQFFLGFGCSLLTIKCGFKYGLALHVLNNSIVAIPIIFLL